MRESETGSKVVIQLQRYIHAFAGGFSSQGLLLLALLQRLSRPGPDQSTISSKDAVLLYQDSNCLCLLAVTHLIVSTIIL